MAYDRADLSCDDGFVMIEDLIGTYDPSVREAAACACAVTKTPW